MVENSATRALETIKRLQATYPITTSSYLFLSPIITLVVIAIILQKKEMVKNSKIVQETDRLFAELDASEWL